MTNSDFTNKVIAHGKILLRHDNNHTISAIIPRIKTMLESCGHHEYNFDNEAAESALYAYRDFLIKSA